MGPLTLWPDVTTARRHDRTVALRERWSRCQDCATVVCTITHRRGYNSQRNNHLMRTTVATMPRTCANLALANLALANPTLANSARVHRAGSMPARAVGVNWPVATAFAALPMALAALLLCAAPVAAQQPGAAPPKQPQSAPKPAAKPKADGASAANTSSDSGLRQRVEGLEEQLVDLQVQLGTLETLAKSSGAASASPAYRAGSADTAGGGAEAGRISGLETQVRTLTQQVQQLTDQVRSLGGQPARLQRDGNVAPSAPSQAQAAAQGATTTVAAAPSGLNPPGWTVSPPPPGAAPRDGAIAGPSDVAGSTLPPVQAAVGPSGGNDPAAAKSAYEGAYLYLLQQDYGAAETAFDDFLQRYPNDSLAGNAQFWLGETHFVRGQYKAAASAFLKGYRSYGRSAKAPDSLLKLAMSLGRLGQRDEACSALGELATKYPQATADVKSRASAEQSRAGCR